MSDSSIIGSIGILIITEYGDIYKYVKEILDKNEFKLSVVKNNEEAIELLKHEHFEIIITEVKIPGVDDFEVVKYVKENKSDSCIIVTAGYGTIQEALQTLKAGAYDFIPKPFDEETIKIILNKAVERQSLFKERNHFRELSMLDGLTEVFNRRHLQEIIEMELTRSARFKHYLSVILIDIDNFKSINDSYGHLSGDKILKEFANTLVENVRSIDYVCRFGGDEFLTILPETGKEGAYNLARRLRNSIVKSKLHIDDKTEVYLTISMGVVTFPLDASNKEELIKKADHALYDVKKLGKGQIALFTDDGKTSLK